MLFFNWAVPEETQPQWVAGAKSKPILNSIGERLIAALPEDPERRLLDRLRKRNGGSGTPGEAASEPPQESSYRGNERRGLDQLIQSTGANNTTPQ